MNGNGNPTEHSEAPEAPGAPEVDLEALRREADEHRDRYIRAVAELDNFRKRSAREIEGARKFGAEKLAQSILPVRDSLEAGLAAPRPKIVSTSAQQSRRLPQILSDSRVSWAASFYGSCRTKRYATVTAFISSLNPRP